MARIIDDCGAARGIRTPDPVITNDVLYRLSYCGLLCQSRTLGSPAVAARPESVLSSCYGSLSSQPNRLSWGRVQDVAGVTPPPHAFSPASAYLPGAWQEPASSKPSPN